MIIEYLFDRKILLDPVSLRIPGNPRRSVVLLSIVNNVSSCLEESRLTWAYAVIRIY